MKFKIAVQVAGRSSKKKKKKKKAKRGNHAKEQIMSYEKNKSCVWEKKGGKTNKYYPPNVLDIEIKSRQNELTIKPKKKNLLPKACRQPSLPLQLQGHSALLNLSLLLNEHT